MFSKEDINKALMLKRIIDQGKYEVVGEAISTVSECLKWYAGLVDTIRAEVENNEMKQASVLKKEKKGE